MALLRRPALSRRLRHAGLTALAVALADYGTAIRADAMRPAGRVTCFPRRGGFTREKAGENRRVTALRVRGRGQQRQRALGRQRAQPADCSPRRRQAKFGGVAPAELGELRRVMPVPAPKLAGRSGITEPVIKGRGVLSQAPGPEPVDEDPGAVPWRRVLIGPADADH